MKPFIKWPGGKQEEYKIISEFFPKKIDKYVEPFVGGGAVYLEIENCNKFYINDISKELIGLYQYIKSQNEIFFNKISDIIHNWNLIECIVKKHYNILIKKYLEYSHSIIDDFSWSDFILEFIIKYSKDFNGILEANFNINIKHFIHVLSKCILDKTRRMKEIEKVKGRLSNDDIAKNIETAIKSAYYTHFRYLYNNYEKYEIPNEFWAAIFYFIREFCYSSMFRYNKLGKFNVPYGGNSYNRKNMQNKIMYMKSQQLIERLSKTHICSLDFEEFLNNIKLTNKDFIFLDPPYDSEFSTYSKNEFNKDDQKRLADYLKITKARFMLVIKNTDYIVSLYQERGFNIRTFKKKYLVSFQNRNNKDVEHLIITNYK